jgi:biopolymer transport protein ExbB
MHFSSLRPFLWLGHRLAGALAVASAALPAVADEMPPLEADATLPRDLSPWGMFMAADHLVKAVMITLALASVLSWTVWLAKSIELVAARMRARHALRTLADSRSLPESTERLRRTSGPVATFVRAADRELRLSADALEKDGVKERCASRIERIEAAAARRMQRGTGILATIGAIGPFVGLFGTVWGIMNSFIGISRAQTTNLAVVAPGIAEALLATALGLAAAIPAVVIFNIFSRSITAYRGLLGDGAAEVMRLLSRDLDRASAAPLGAAPHHRLPTAAE